MFITENDVKATLLENNRNLGFKILKVKYFNYFDNKSSNSILI